MEYKSAFRHWLRTGDDTELRAMGEAGGTGGYLFANEFHAELATQLKSYARLVADFNVIGPTANGRPMVAPTAQVSPVGVVTAENPGSALAFTSDRTFGSVTLNAWTVTSSGKVSFQLEQDSGIPVESMIADLSGEVVGRELSVLSVSGSGTNQPTGILAVANTQGSAGTVGGAITATGGYLTLAAAGAIEVDGAATTELISKGISPKTLRAMVQAVDPSYQAGSKFYFSPTQFNVLCGTTDTNNQPILGYANGAPSIWGFPVEVANEIPDLAAITLGGAVFGNFTRGMYYRDAGFEVIRTSERFADALAVGYVGVQRCDFAARDARAFVTVKPAAT